jgi:hypothetical protein
MKRLFQYDHYDQQLVEEEGLENQGEEMEKQKHLTQRCRWSQYSVSDYPCVRVNLNFRSVFLVLVSPPVTGDLCPMERG